MASIASTPPASDEYELTILGPGYGESIVVHVGQGLWIVVDSCIDKASGEPAALSYLASLGVDSSSVALILASHWHDDHIRGLADLVAQCTSATFVCSEALNSREFLALASNDNLSQARLPSGVSEFRRVIEAIAGRDPRLTKRVPVFASADKILWEKEVAGEHVRVLALTPSAAAEYSAKQDLAMASAGVTSKRLNIPSITPNHASVAVTVSRGDDAYLLGADLEVTAAPDMGWDGVLQNTVTPTQGSAYKVAHHGSANGHHDGIFAELLHERPVCVLAPFRKGSVSLPTDTDIARLRSASGDQLYCTSLRRGPRETRDSATTRTLREMGAKIGPVDNELGIVQMRGNAAVRQVGLSAAAGKLT